MTTTEKIRALEKELAIETQKKLDNIAIGDTVYGVYCLLNKGAYELGKVVDVARWQLNNKVNMVKVLANGKHTYTFMVEEYGRIFFVDKEQAEEYLKQAKR